MKRSCDGCAECCKGKLHGTALGHDFSPGRPCYFLQKTCSIYENRPIDPCQTYQCHWLASDDLPMWMRPDLSGVIVTQREKDGIQYIEVIESGRKLDSSVLSWLCIWALNNNKNIKYQIDGGFHKIGSKDFVAAKI